MVHLLDSPLALLGDKIEVAEAMELGLLRFFPSESGVGERSLVLSGVLCDNLVPPM